MTGVQTCALPICRLNDLAKDRELPHELVGPLRTYYRDRLKRIEQRADSEHAQRKMTALGDEIGLLLIKAERDVINDLYRHGKLKDESRRRIERALDLREADTTNLQAED